VPKLSWDNTGEHFFETGVSKGVLYLADDSGAYTTGVAWNGLTKVTEKPVGATPTPMYADNTKYLNLLSTEYFEAEIDAYTYPVEFEACDGTVSPEPGVGIGQQPREQFGLSYRTQLGNEVVGSDLGYKVHLVYNALAAPSQKDFSTINDTPTAVAFAWSITTTPLTVSGYKPTATLTIESTKVDPTALASLEAFLYGTSGSSASLPTPEAVLALFSGTVSTVTPTAPTLATHALTIPTVTGVTYYIDGAVVTGVITITATVDVYARPNDGYQFPPLVVPEWEFVYV
jgi:hypothetical protein